MQITLAGASFGWGDAPPTATGVNLKLEKVRFTCRDSRLTFNIACFSRLSPLGAASSTVLSCPVLSCPVLSCPILSCPVLSCPVETVRSIDESGGLGVIPDFNNNNNNALYYYLIFSDDKMTAQVDER